MNTKRIIRNILVIVLTAVMTLSDTAGVFASTECSAKDAKRENK